MKACVFDAKKNSLWDCYSSAEPFQDGDPVYRMVNGWEVVIDRCGMEASKESDKDFDTVFIRNFELGSQRMALALLNGLPDDFQPVTFEMERE